MFLTIELQNSDRETLKINVRYIFKKFFITEKNQSACIYKKEIYAYI